MKAVKVVGKFTDALWISIQGRLRGGILAFLEATKEVSQEEFGGAEVPVPDLPGGDLRMHPAGRGRYPFVLENDVVYLEITEQHPLPALRIHFRAPALYEHGLRGAEDITDLITDFFLEPGFSCVVTRYDLAVDFQCEGWELPDRRDVITRATTWKVEGDGPEPNGITFGRRNGTVQVQVYNKTEQIQSKHKAGWVREPWEASGVYDGRLPVWRMELRFFSKKLRTVGVNTIADLRDGQGDLVRAVLGGGGVKSWFRIVSPDTRGRKSDRCPPALWWESVREAALDGLPATGTLDRRRYGGPNLDHTKKNMLFPGLERFMVQGGGEGLHPTDTPPEEFLDLLLEQYREHLADQDLTLGEALDRRRAKMGRARMAPVPSVTR